ncbi:hypothetical protein BKA69DRAFT_1122525 [Paraphysoderma sedebokerense]|nr:hypothetical protein BKA69DRAFT_1122525 [Paraphysoderma sedebokerense]
MTQLSLFNGVVFFIHPDLPSVQIALLAKLLTDNGAVEAKVRDASTKSDDFFHEEYGFSLTSTTHVITTLDLLISIPPPFRILNQCEHDDYTQGYSQVEGHNGPKIGMGAKIAEGNENYVKYLQRQAGTSLDSNEQNLLDELRPNDVTIHSIVDPYETRASEGGTCVVLPEWVETSVLHKTRYNEDFYLVDPMLPLAGTIIAFSNPSDNVDEYLNMFAAVTACGGQYRCTLTRDVTHLVCINAILDEPCKSKLSLDEAFRNRIDLVNHMWFLDSLNTKCRLPEHSYMINIDWRTARMIPPSIRHNVEEHAPQASYISPFNIERIPDPPIKFLQDKTIWVSPEFNFSDDIRDKCRDLLRKAGARVLGFGQDLGEDDFSKIDIFIFKYTKSNEWAKAERAGKVVGSLHWLCYIFSVHKITNPKDKVLFYPTPRGGIEQVLTEAWKMTVTNYDGFEREYLKACLPVIGAHYTGDMTAANTHLISSCARGAKFRTAQRWPIIRIVNHLWIEECMQQWKVLDINDPRYSYMPNSSSLQNLVGTVPVDPKVIKRRLAAFREKTVDESKALEIDPKFFEGFDENSGRRAAREGVRKIHSAYKEIERLPERDRKIVIESMKHNDEDDDDFLPNEPAVEANELQSNHSQHPDGTKNISIIKEDVTMDDKSDLTPLADSPPIIMGKRKVRELDAVDNSDRWKSSVQSATKSDDQVLSTKRSKTHKEILSDYATTEGLGSEIISEKSSKDKSKLSKSDYPSKIQHSSRITDSADARKTTANKTQNESKNEFSHHSTKEAARPPSSSVSFNASSKKRTDGSRRSFQKDSAEVNSSSKQKRTPQVDELIALCQPSTDEPSKTPSLIPAETSVVSSLHTPLQYKHTTSTAEAIDLVSEKRPVVSRKSKLLAKDTAATALQTVESKSLHTTPQLESSTGTPASANSATASRKSSNLNQSGSQRSSKRRSNASVRKIAFTRFEPTKEIIKGVRALSGKVDNFPFKDCTHLVTDRICRTIKFLYAISSCKHIVTTNWLYDSIAAGEWQDEEKYIIQGTDFDLAESLRRASQKKLLAGYKVFFTPKALTFLSRDDLTLRDVVECCGGKVVKKLISSRISEDLPIDSSLIISRGEDEPYYTQHFLKKKLKYKIYSVEVLVLAVLSQDLNLDFEGAVLAEYEDNN